MRGGRVVKNIKMSNSRKGVQRNSCKKGFFANVGSVYGET